LSVIDRLTDELARLPGIGRKTAVRLTYHLLKTPAGEVNRLAEALVTLTQKVRACVKCGNYTESELCPICANPRRDLAVICVVEQASDIGAIERAGEFRGTYHVLGGRLSPLDGIGPAELNIAPLMERVKTDGEIQEVILATNPSVEGEATALYLHRLLAPLGLRVTRLARGLPIGGDLEYADGVTIAEALHSRREL
jgi:recombination protein RecR